jgi:hypothetical protein
VCHRSCSSSELDRSRPNSFPSVTDDSGRNVRFRPNRTQMSDLSRFRVDFHAFLTNSDEL